MTLDREITLANWLLPPYNRTSFRQVRQVVPTAPIGTRTDRRSVFPERLDESLATVPCELVDGSATTFGEQFDTSFGDAVCVVHDGTAVFERFAPGMAPDTLHLLMSVSKSVCAATLGVTIGRGVISADDLVTDVAPEFAGSSLDGATVQHVIDMTAGTDFVEDYDLYDDSSGDNPLLAFERHSGYRPLGAEPPIGTLALFRTYSTAFDHGGRFQYRSPLTNVAARLVELANGAYQYLYVHRPSRTVIARFSTYPKALDMTQSAETMAALQALCESMP